jgi:glyoxylase-like metal-dependent hydrolase (beta-lactamase superfamily II)
MASRYSRHSEENLRAERTDGVTNDPQTALATLRAIKELATAERTIILPAHDPGVPARLAALQGASFRAGMVSFRIPVQRWFSKRVV